MTIVASFSPVRRAVCSISAGSARATGWLVSPKGLFATSHSTIGYQVDTEVENDSGDRRVGRVVWVDVSRDLAVVLAETLPRGPEPMVPLALREAPVIRPGDRGHVVSALAGRGLRVTPASVCSVVRGAAIGDVFELDVAAPGPLGGPLVDTENRAMGLLVRGVDPSRASGGRKVVLLPSSEVRGALRTLENASDLGRRSPIYRCPTCATPFVPEHDACLSCGVPLPHPFPPVLAAAVAERAVRNALATMSVVANRARIGPSTWQVTSRPQGVDPVAITLSLEESGAAVVFRTGIASAARVAHEPFYRLLLTLNDQSTGPFRLALSGDRVVLVLVTSPAMLEGRELGPMLMAMAEVTDHYRKLLREGFDVPPLLLAHDPLDF